MTERVIELMSEWLNEDQLAKLREVMEKVQVESKTKQIKINLEYLKDFEMTKRYEGCSENTIKAYTRDVRIFISTIDKSVIEVSKKDIENYLSQYKDTHNVCNVSVNNMRRNLSAFFNYLECDDIIASNPVKKIKPIKVGKVIKDPLSELEIDKLRMNTKHIRDKAIIDTLLSTGMRVSEMCSLNINDLDNKSALVKGKGNKERYVYFTDLAWSSINEYLKTRDDDNLALFVGVKKKNGEYHRLGKDGAEKLIKDLGDSINVCAFPHKFRRTMASNALNKGMPIQEVQALLGHTNINTTMIYCKVRQDSVKYSHNKYVG